MRVALKSDSWKGFYMKKYLIDEMPLIIMPTLAKVIGLNESIVLQQIHYWLNNSNHEFDDRKWIFNTLEEWHKQFPFWSLRTLQRIFDDLTEKGILIKGNYNKMKLDRTTWYTIDYDKLTSQIDVTIQSNCLNGFSQNDYDNNQIITQIIHTDNNNIHLDKMTKSKEPKKDFAEFVKMTNSEYELLIEKYGKENVQKMIEVLDNYKGSKNKKYASDYRAILNWVVERVMKVEGHKKHDEGKYKFDF